MNHVFVYAQVCRKFPNVQSPASGTTENSIPKITTIRIG